MAVDQGSEALALCKELLNLLNNCRPSMSGGLEEHVLGWVHSSPSSALLYPLVAAAATSVASLPAMLRLIEACMETHFLAGKWRQKRSYCHYSLISLRFDATFCTK